MKLPRGRLWIPVVVLALAAGLAQLRSPIGAAASAAAEGQQASARAQPSGFVFGGAAGRTVDTAPLRRGLIASTIDAPGTIQAGSEVGVSAPFEGTVLEIVKDEGDRVEEGDVIFRLDPRDYAEKVTEAELDLARKRSALAEAEAAHAEARRKQAEADEEPSDVTEARLKVRQSELGLERAGAQLDAAKAKLARDEQMLRQGIGRQVDVEAARSEHAVASIGVRIAEEELTLAKETRVFREDAWARTRRDAAQTALVAEATLSRARADLRTAELGLERARRDLERCEVRAPLRGLVTARGVNRGDLVSRPAPESPHAIVSDLDHLFAYLDVDEGDVVRVRELQRAKVTVHALEDDAPLWGRVYDVGLRATQKQGEDVKTFRVRVLLDEGQPRLAKLRPGMSTTAQVETGRAEQALKVPLQAVLRRERRELPADLATKLPEAVRGPLAAAPAREDALLDVVVVVVDGAARLRVVRLGLLDADEAEVLDGLEPEAEVVVGPYRVLEALAEGDRVVARRAAHPLFVDGEEGGVAAVTSAP